MTENAAFLAVVLINIFAICGALGMLLHERLHRPVDLRHAWFLLILTFAGVLLRGQPYELLSWPPVLVALVLVARQARSINVRIRTRRLLGRAVPHT